MSTLSASAHSSGATVRVLNLWLAVKSPSSTMMSGLSALVRSAMARMRSAGISGPPACTSAMTPMLKIEAAAAIAAG